jgi:hypothetical protein
MDGALVLITLASLGTTGAVLFYAARLVRDERTRSHARVTALAEEIGRPAARSARAPAPVSRGATARSIATEGAPREQPGSRGLPPATGTPARTDVGPRRATSRDALPDAALFPARHTGPADDAVRQGPAVAGGTLFRSASTESASNRWRVPVIGAMIVVLALATIYFVSGQPEGAARPARTVAGTRNVPLELVSLSQARKGDTLTVSGLVRNPPAATERRQVAAVVFVFDRNGSFLASGRAPLDYQALAPGDESPFVITVPGAADVSRYRVSFREGDDVLAHVDRRDPSPAAQQPAGTR